MKLKLQIAEAERAKAEAELAKSRAEAEASKQRADAELARQRTAPRVVAERNNTPPAPAVPAMTGVPAASNVAPGAGASNAAMGAVSGIAPAPSSGAPPAPPPSAVAGVAPSAPPGVAFVPVASGSGTATRDCEEFEEMRAFSEARLAVRVDDGVITVERGTRGQAGYLIAKGRPTADGRLSLSGTAIAANRRNLGKEIGVYFSGAYADGVFALSGRTGLRTCRMTIRLDARQ